MQTPGQFYLKVSLPKSSTFVITTAINISDIFGTNKEIRIVVVVAELMQKLVQPWQFKFELNSTISRYLHV